MSKTYEDHLKNFLDVPEDFMPELDDYLKNPYHCSNVWELQKSGLFLLTMSGGGWSEPSWHLLDESGTVLETGYFDPRKREEPFGPTGRWLRWPKWVK